MKNLYTILGVATSATKEEIQKAYRRMAQATHPDREGGSTEAFQEVEEAGRVLLDDEARARYDQTGSALSGPDRAMIARNCLVQGWKAVWKPGMAPRRAKQLLLERLAGELHTAKRQKADIEDSIKELSEEYDMFEADAEGFNAWNLVLDARKAEFEAKLEDTETGIEMLGRVKELVEAMQQTKKGVEKDKLSEKKIPDPTTLEDLIHSRIRAGRCY